MINLKAVIFDLDGTLLDSLADIANAANRALAEYGYPIHPLGDYKMFVGDGAKTLITRILPKNNRREMIIDACYHRFAEDYKQNWQVATKPYPGIMELIQLLVEKEIKMSVVTNKPHGFAEAMMAHYFKEMPFFPIMGQQDGIPKKPHPQQALAAAAKMGVSPVDCLFLGDSNVDMKTALRANMHPVGAGWGFRTHQELLEAGALMVLDQPMELMHLTLNRGDP